jgi:hypothetical protein
MASISRRSTLRSSFGSFTSRKRKANGTESVHCLNGAMGSTSLRCRAVSCARRAPHEGHQARDLQENATSSERAQSSHFTTVKPRRTSPQAT